MPGPSNTCCYVVSCPSTKEAVLIDTCVNFDAATGKISYTHADSVVEYVRQQGFKVDLILETHVHADHLSAAQYVKSKVGASRVGIGANVSTVQETFTKLYNLGEGDCPKDGSNFELLLREGDSFKVGTLQINVLHTPGHTPACCTYVVGDAVFVGDTFFMPDVGTARCDFPGGSCEDLWTSLNKILALPDQTRMFVCHDYPKGRDFAWETSVGEQKEKNIFMKTGVTRDGFIAARKAKDEILSAPGLLHHSLQVNIRAGHLPPEEDNGTAYLKLPLSVLSVRSGHD
jgi:glyoxylase-like metal-dependent hydrolase (beta-lactamase superfamily II)